MLKLKNSNIALTVDFLNRVALKTKASRARTTLVNKLSEKHQQLVVFEDEILQKYAKKDEDSKVIKNDQGMAYWEEAYIKEGNQALQELHDEDVYISIEEYLPNMKILKVALEALDMELSGNDAIVYDQLLEQLEEETKGE